MRHHFLIAMPHLKDPHFEGTVTYICDHTEDGAMGIVVNRVLDVKLSEILEQLEISRARYDEPVYFGGPVQLERGFVLHREGGQWKSSANIVPDVHVTTSRDIIEAIAEGWGPPEHIIALGYAGWQAGQLEEEVANNAWLTCPASSDVLFNIPPDAKLSYLTGQLGIDYSMLTDQAGHG
ncbi:MAG: YqgE/AlgH family protein [Gammaproteobacteria bacterium]|nr:MAG: YqgE/AlgH family protein [Gammaproteobacteria bacterium]